MRLFPREHYFLTTKLSQDEVERRLFKNTDTNQPQLSHMFNLRSDKTFCGNISNNGFNIFRPAGFLNRNAPFIRGNTFTGADETIIEIKITMDISDYIVITFFLAIVTLSTLSMIVSSIKDGAVQPGLLLMLVMFVVIMSVHVFSIKRHNRKSKKLLMTILGAEDINQ